MTAENTGRHVPLMTRRRLLYAGGAAGLGAAAAWWMWPLPGGDAAPVTTDAIGDQVQTLPRGQLPVFAESPDIRDLYRYAVDHGEELQYIPCFCGCGQLGHLSNRECYIKAFNADGTLTFTSHAAT